MPAIYRRGTDRCERPDPCVRMHLKLPDGSADEQQHRHDKLMHRIGGDFLLRKPPGEPLHRSRAHAREPSTRGQIMNQNHHNATARSRGVKATLAALVFVVAMGTTFLMVDRTDAVGHMGELELLSTYTSQSLQASGYCSGDPSRPTCKEVCLICGDGGHIIPQGIFKCLP